MTDRLGEPLELASIEPAAGPDRHKPTALSLECLFPGRDRAAHGLHAGTGQRAKVLETFCWFPLIKSRCGGYKGDGGAGMSEDRPHPINDPAHWRQRAQEARALADQIEDPQGRVAMLRIAQEYELLAKRAAARAVGRHP